MFTNPQTQQLKALIRDFTLADPAFQTALNDVIADALGSVLTTQGDVLRRGSSEAERLALGALGEILSSDGTDVKYQTLSALLDAVFSNTQGSVLYRGSSAWAALAPGTSGQFLKTQGAGANPVWGTVATPVDTKIETRTSLSGNQSFTGLAGYQTVGLVLDGVTKASGGKLAIRVSTDNGSTFKSSSGDYYFLSSTTLKKTDTTELILHSSDNTGPAYGTFIISQFSLATPKVMRGSFNLSYSVATTTPLNAIQLLSVGAGGAINGGTVHLVGIPGS